MFTRLNFVHDRGEDTTWDTSETEDAFIIGSDILKKEVTYVTEQILETIITYRQTLKCKWKQQKKAGTCNGQLGNVIVYLDILRYGLNNMLSHGVLPVVSLKITAAIVKRSKLKMSYMFDILCDNKNLTWCIHIIPKAFINGNLTARTWPKRFDPIVDVLITYIKSLSEITTD